MKLAKVLSKVNQHEKGYFLKLLDSISGSLSSSRPDIEKLLKGRGGHQLAKEESGYLTELFALIAGEFRQSFAEQLCYGDHHPGIFFEIFIRDGNSVMSRDWLKSLYGKEITTLRSRVGLLKESLENPKSKLDPGKRRDYAVYRECVSSAWQSSQKNQHKSAISREANRLLHTLATALGLSADEARMLRYLVLPLQELDIDESIAALKETGVLFFSKKHNMVYVPDETVSIIRSLCGREIPDKYFRRILRELKDVEVNRLARRHNIKADSRPAKIAALVNEGVDARKALSEDIFLESVSVQDRKDRIAEVVEKGLMIELKRTGATLEQRIDRLFEYFNADDSDDNARLTSGGFHAMLEDLKKSVPGIENRIRADFEIDIRERESLDVAALEDYGIAPLDVLYLLSNDEIASFRKEKEIGKKGNPRNTIIAEYFNIDELYIAQYELISSRNIEALKEAGLPLKDAELGQVFQDVTRKIFEKLGLNVDDSSKKELNTGRHKMDLLIDLGNDEVIVVECKTHKDANYDKYTSVSRQLKSYVKLCEGGEKRVARALVIADDFSPGFVDACVYDTELNISLLTSAGLKKLLAAFSASKLKRFPVKFLTMGGRLHPDKMAEALSR